MKKVNQKWFRHEALHTTSVILEMMEEHLKNHHYYHSGINPKFNENIDKAIDSIFQAYQDIGGGRENEVKKKIKVDHL